LACNRGGLVALVGVVAVLDLEILSSDPLASYRLSKLFAKHEFEDF
jgi:hypothetical protein